MRSKNIFLGLALFLVVGLSFGAVSRAADVIVPGHWTISSNGHGKACPPSIDVKGGNASWDCDGSTGICAEVGGDGSLIIHSSPYAGNPDPGGPYYAHNDDLP